MDTLILMIAVIGLSVSGWFLRGYFIDTPSGSVPVAEAKENDSGRVIPDSAPPVGTEIGVVDSTTETETLDVNREAQQRRLTRLHELVKQGYVFKFEPPGPPRTDTQAETNGAVPNPDEPFPDNNAGQTTSVSQQSAPSTEKPQPQPDGANAAGAAVEAAGVLLANADPWNEIYALQQAYKQEREQETEVDYEREQALFDLSQGSDSRPLVKLTPGDPDAVRVEEETQPRETVDRQLDDNRLEAGESLAGYHQRMNQFASLTKEMLMIRLDAANEQLRQQQEKYQASLLSIIASLIERTPADFNLQRIAQASLKMASAEQPFDEEQAPNPTLFQEMFHQFAGR